METGGAGQENAKSAGIVLVLSHARLLFVFLPFSYFPPFGRQCFIRIMLASFLLLFFPARLCIIRLHKQCRIAAEKALCLLTLVHNQSRVCSVSVGHIFSINATWTTMLFRSSNQCWGIIAFDLFLFSFSFSRIVRVVCFVCSVFSRRCESFWTWT